MLKALKDLIDSFTTAAPGPAADEHSLQLATAVLLVEVMRADPAATPGESEAVLSALRRKFALTPAELEQLVALAQDKARGATDFFAFTSVINERFTHPQKVEIVEHMWQVAYADGQVEENENHLISKVAGLLHVTHGEYIAAKLHARDAAARP